MSGRLRLSAHPVGPSDLVSLFRGLLGRRNPFFLDSSLPEVGLSSQSFLGADPAGWFRSRGRRCAFACPWGEESRAGNPLELLRVFLDLLPRADPTPGFPFAGGLVGYLGYDLGRSIETLSDAKAPDLGTPDIHFAIYPQVVAVDHASGEAFTLRGRDFPRYNPPPLPEYLAVPQEPTAIPPLDRAAYLRSIETAKKAIWDGEIFQVNLSHRQALRLPDAPEEAYLRLRSRTPSAFGGYLDASDHRVLSASPERFLSVRGREVETRPIKGTRPRGHDPDEDGRLARELLGSEKDAAENVMIVDLERNDLGKVCEFGSVHVPVLQRLRSLPNVHHLESVVVGRLRPGVEVPELLAATFPGGSITGAPKPRAMEIIESLEPHRRGVYTGALGYVSWDGTLDLNIMIRTAAVIGDTAYFAVGGGIVADSNPAAEFRETMDKFRGHAEALTGDRVEVTVEGLQET